MSKRQPKFKIKFNKITEEATGKNITEILVNKQVVGYIYPPGYDTHATEFHHITLLLRVIGSPNPKTLPNVFGSDKQAREYINHELQNIHLETPLYLPNGKEPKRKALIKFGEDWVAGL